MIYVIREDEVDARLKLTEQGGVPKEEYLILEGVPYKVLGYCMECTIERLLSGHINFVNM